MWKSKKFIVISVVVAVVMVATTAGVVLAQDGKKGPGPRQAILGKVAKNLGITQQQLEDAFKKALEEGRTERNAALLEKLQQLVKDGKITTKQVEDFKTWLKARPANPKENPQQFQDWMKKRPDLPFPKPDGAKGPRPGPGFRGPKQAPPVPKPTS